MKTSPANHTVLFLNENSLPSHYTTSTIAGKELRLRSALKTISNVHVLTFKGNIPLRLPPGKKTALEKKIIVHQLPSWPHYAKTIPLTIAGLYYAYRLKPSTIEAESPLFSGLAAIIISQITHIPSVIEVRTTFMSLTPYRLRFVPPKLKIILVSRWQQFVLKHATFVIANSRYYASLLTKQGVKSTIINPGLQYPPAHHIALPLRSTCVLGYIGRLVPEKGVGMFIQAIEILARLSNLPSYSVSIIGDGPQRHILERSVKNKHLNHIIRFKGSLPPYQAIKSLDVLINPCLVDAPLEMINAEAAYCRRPVIVFGHKNLPETVKDYQTGLVIPEKSASALALAIKKLLEEPDLRHQLGENGHLWAQSEYSFSKQVKKLQHLYQHGQIM